MFSYKILLKYDSSVFEGSLALVPDNSVPGEESYSVWIIKEYGMAESWTKLFNVEIGGREKLSRLIYSLPKECAVLLTSDLGKLLLLTRVLKF